MRVGIVIDPNWGITAVLRRYKTILEQNGVDHLWLDTNAPDFWDSLSGIDLIIFHWTGTVWQYQLAHTILPVIEQVRKIRCFPDTATWWAYDDKVREYYLLREHGFPCIPSWIFWDKRTALAWLEIAEYPLVFKLKGGASSANVVLVKNKAYAQKLVSGMFGRGIISGNLPGWANVRWKDPYTYIREIKNRMIRTLRGDEVAPYGQLHQHYVLFQKFLPNNTFDTRVTIIGERAFLSRRHIRENDFRASGSGNDDWDQSRMDRRTITQAFEISRTLKFQCMSYDFLYDEKGEPLLSEISYTSPDWTVWSCPGYWDEDFGWYEGHFWPQYCVLRDLLESPTLIQPPMEPE